jgi:hypothetical protein
MTLWDRITSEQQVAHACTTMTIDQQRILIEELARSNRDMMRPDATRALFAAVGGAVSQQLRFSRWLNAAVGACIVVVVSNLSDISDALRPGVFPGVLWCLLGSGLLGVGSEWVAVQATVLRAMQSQLERRLDAVRLKSEPLTSQIEQLADSIPLDARLYPTGEEVAAPLLDALWWPNRKLMLRSLRNDTENPWRSHQALVRCSQWHGLVVLLQFLAAAAALAQIAAGLRSR